MAKRSTLQKVILLFILAFFILSGLTGIALSQLFFPAPVFVMPSADSVLSMQVEIFDDHQRIEHTVITDQKTINSILTGWHKPKRTFRRSVHDAPMQTAYIKIRCFYEGGMRTWFLYLGNGICYIEEPYVGIYRTRQNAYHTTLSYSFS